MLVRKLRRDEVEAWRTIRLRALSDSPAAFSSTYEVCARWEPEVWDRRVQDLTADADSVMFLADDAGSLVGTAGAYIDAEAPATPQLISMWVDPAVRARGVGRLLVEAVADWARSRGFSALHLYVVAGNDGARALYEKCDFRLTGRSIPLPGNPALRELELLRDLHA